MMNKEFNKDKVILVDVQDTEIGTADKLEAHQQGLLHRAFSVFIYKKTGENIEILLQQRHPEKYHSGGLWTNTCCSHPFPGEDIKDAAIRRLHEEMGITADLREIGVFSYKSPVGNDLIENEIDHVFIGEINNIINIKFNPTEIIDYQFLDINQLKQNILDHPDQYTAWLLEALELVALQAL